MTPGKREGIVALTQTEIMLVLAVVILLLLVAKNADLNEARMQIAEMQAPVLGEDRDGADNPETENNSAETAPPPETESDPNAPVTKTLVSGGAPVQPPQPLGVEEDSPQPETTDSEELLKELSAENTRLQNENMELKEKIAALRTAPSADAEAGEKRPDNPPAPQQNTGQAETDKRIINEVGFLPCWLGTGRPRYYFTYNLAYFPESDKFRIGTHRDLQSGAGVVRRALAGELAAVYGHPKGLISRADFLRFAKKITAAQKRFYGNNGCRLAVTINKRGVDLTVTNDFIFTRAGFYPVGRGR